MLGTLVFLLVVSFMGREPAGDELGLSEFEVAVEQGRVVDAVIYDGDQTVTGSLADGTEYRTTYPTEYADDLTALLRKAGVPTEVDAQKPNALVGTLITVILPVLLIGGILLFVMNRSQGGGGRVMQFGRSKHKTVNKDQPKTTFGDVAGVDEAIEELQEVKDYLQHPSKFQAMGAKIPRGVLLFGPPGTGKTLLARAVAGEAGVPFFSISGSDFVEMFVGVGAARVRDLFEQAKASAPGDRVHRRDRRRRPPAWRRARRRTRRARADPEPVARRDGRVRSALHRDPHGGHEPARHPRPRAAAARALRPAGRDRPARPRGPQGDPARARPGQAVRRRPSTSRCWRAAPPASPVPTSRTSINEAALLAARRNKRAISMKEIEEAVDRVMAGPERKSRVMDEEERRLIAYHEGGHAMVAHVLPNTDEVHKITVIPRGRALGYTLTLPEQDKFLMTREQLRDELAMLMGGRVAEEIVAGDVTTGAGNDIERATKIARQMVTEYGMSDSIGPRTLGQKQGEVFLGRDWGSTPDYSDAVAFEIDHEVRELIDEAHDVALDILTENRAKLDALAARLIEVETMDRDDVEPFFADVERR